MNKTYSITTLGCQMNEHDSEIMAGMLQEAGYQESHVRNAADVILINTCSVRDNADKRFFGILGQLKKIKQENPGKVIGVCGCMMQQQHIVDGLKAKYPWVDLVFGTHNIHELPKLLENIETEHEKLVAVWEGSETIVEGLPSHRKHKHSAYVTIMYGCDNFCTYCIVPYTRGRERSRKPEEILAEVAALGKDGAKEITLLGQNVNSYRGQGESNEEMDFSSLIYALNEIEGIERIRFMTSHPKDLSDSLIRAYRECEKLCPHIHLPVQSGSSKVLKSMNRKYSREDYLSLVGKLKEALPRIAITTDIIVGFPGESEEDFAETLSLVDTVRFDSAFTFLYSIRKGTPAEHYEEQIPEEIKHERFERLVDLVNQISSEKNAAETGTIQKVLVESVSKTNKNALSGRTGGHKLVNFLGDKNLVGTMVKVRITESNTFSLFGVLEP
ncbi:MAG: tRNA (N6-isopentenyl adenosine(37)-C2)-methylthiotransferase MiaB [Eubacteriales bacterium]|nr:tRNA (N6-isopentenyl adenosine(37)-C2)-methylthiotransferase MiaB [Eubacteriales bacterium]